MKKIWAIGLIFFFLVVVPVFAAQSAAETAKQPEFVQSILDPVGTSLAKVGGYLPKLGGLLLILVFGALIAVGVTALVKWILGVIHLEKGAKKIKAPEILKKGGIGLSLSDLIADIVFFLVIIITLITALEFYGLVTAPLTSQVLAYIPSVIAAVFILVLGILLAVFIGGIITLVGGNVRIAQSETFGNIAKYAVIVFAALVALKELGAGGILTDNSKDIILGGLVLALAIAFGMGAKDKAEKFLNTIFKK